MNIQQQRQATHKQRKDNVARKNKAKQSLMWREHNWKIVKQAVYNKQNKEYWDLQKRVYAKMAGNPITLNEMFVKRFV